jgi:hypothetical protein
VSFVSVAGRACRAALATSALFIFGAQGTAYAQSVARSDYTFLAGYLGVTADLHDRAFSTSWANTYWSNGVGLHAEAHGMNREEVASFGAVGVSYEANSTRVKGTLGTSSDNREILPSFYARLEGEIKSDPAKGIVLSPSLTYRSFRSGVDEVALQGQSSFYMPAANDAYWVIQLLGRATFVSPGEDWIPAVGGSLTYASYKKYSVGLASEIGRSSYETAQGAANFNENYVSLRPTASVYVNNQVELSLTGEYTKLESYEVNGVMAGLRVHFD